LTQKLRRWFELVTFGFGLLLGADHFGAVLVHFSVSVQSRSGIKVQIKSVSPQQLG
jgi:hypothetical protein